MTPQGEIIVAVVALLAAALMIYLTKRQKLTVGYGLFWLGLFVVAAFLAVWSDALELVTGLVGARYPVSAMTLLGFVMVIGILVIFSIRLSKLHMQVVELSRYLGMLEHELGRKDRPTDPW